MPVLLKYKRQMRVSFFDDFGIFYKEKDVKNYILKWEYISRGYNYEQCPLW